MTPITQQLTALSERIADLEADLKIMLVYKFQHKKLCEHIRNSGHRNEPENFTGDKMIGYLQACEDIISENRALLKDLGIEENRE